MSRNLCCVVAVLALGHPLAGVRAAKPKLSWTVYVASDNCPDYTWGLTEEQTRQILSDETARCGATASTGAISTTQPKLPARREIGSSCPPARPAHRN